MYKWQLYYFGYYNFAAIKWHLTLFITFLELKSEIFVNFLYKMNWEFWADDINSLICLIISLFGKTFCENLWKFKIQKPKNKHM